MFRMAIFRMRKNRLARAERTDSDVLVAQTTEISELLASGQWVRGRTEHELAARWGVAIQSVRNRAAEARRLVQHAYSNLEELRALVQCQLEGIASETRKTEPRTAVTALMGLAAVSGLVVTRHNDSRPIGPDKRLSPQQRREEIARIRAQLDEADAIAVAELGAIDVPGVPQSEADE